MPFASRAPFRRPKALLLSGAVLAGFLGLGSATMVLAAPRYIAVCPAGSDDSCATVSTEGTQADAASAETSVIALGGADSSSLTLSNTNASGSATLTVIGSFDTANPSSAGSVFAAAKTAIGTTIAIKSGESRVIRVPDLPAGAKSVLIRLSPRSAGDEAGAAENSDEQAVAKVDFATGGSSVSARDVRSALEKLRAIRASASPTPAATSEPRESESRIDDVVDEVVTETLKPAPPTAEDAEAAAPDDAEAAAPDDTEKRSGPRKSAADKPASPAAKKTPAKKPAAAATSKPTTKPAPEPAPKPTTKSAPTPATPRQNGGAGVPPGTQLTKVSGDVVVTVAGTVLDSKDIHGRVIVKAPNVTIRNSVIRGADSGSKWGLIDALAGHPGLRVLDSEIVATTPNYTVNGIMGFNFELNRVNIHGVIDQVHVTGGNVVIANSWLHDNVHYENDPSHSDGSHDDNVQIQKGDGIRITNNVMTNAHNAAVQITQDAGKVSNVTISGNRADHGGCTINIAEKGRGPIQGIRIADNIFGRGTVHANCAVIAPTSTKLSLGNNIYTDGAPVSVRKGG